MSLAHDRVPHGTEVITSGLTGLSAREREVVILVCEGLSEKEIARRMNTTPKAVSALRHQAGQKTGAHKAATLVRWAIRKGLIEA